MATTYEKIQSTTLGSATATITFNSISSAYTDLRLVLVASGSSNFNYNITYNNDSSALYSTTVLRADGASAYSDRNSGETKIPLTFYANYGTTPFLLTLDLFSYAGSTFKTALITQSNDRNGSGSVEQTVALYRSTTAISRIDLNSGAPYFNTGTIATIYGILKA
jgi:hypothetical protein